VSALRGRLGRAPDWRWRPEWDRSTTEPVDVVSGACMVIPRALFEALGGLDEGFRLYFEEDDLCRRVRKAGSDVLLCAEIEVMHAWAKSTSQMDPALRSAIGQESLFRAAEKRYGTWFRRVLQGASVPRRAVSAIRSRRRAPAA
jgi:GT2 family glycosyltransferase